MTPVVEISDEKQFEFIFSPLNPKKSLIFKYSPICVVSSMAQGQWEKFKENSKENLDLFQVDVINHRPLSQKIAEIIGVRHESPQALLIENGKCIWNTSHSAITLETLTTAVK